MLPALKGYKITDADRKLRVGIAAKDLNELKNKTIQKFKLTYKECEIDFQTPDGTTVDCDEYLGTLPSQPLLIWVMKGERAETDAEILYKTIREVNEEYLKAGEKVQEFFTEKMKTKVFKLAEILKGVDGDKAKLSTKTEHPEWFEGLDTRAKTKEDFMFRKAQDRIRTFYYKTKEELIRLNKKMNIPLDKLNTLLNDLQNLLKLNKYNGHLFDRKASIENPDVKSICDNMGVFRCGGRWNKLHCLYTPMHTINPYSSREERIIFQTWNFDHQIERARSVIPAIYVALKQCCEHSSSTSLIRENRKEMIINYKAIYNDLFTMYNLKLVHIICHDKGAHTSKKPISYLTM